VTPIEMALRYAARFGEVFPCEPSEPKRKKPLTKNGFYDASRNPGQIRRWWRDRPDALIGLPTGKRSGLVVLDIDMKNGVNGFAMLAMAGHAVEVSQYETGRVKTSSGGMHVYFDTGGRPFRCSKGESGLGPGLDVRGDGGYVIAPSPGSGYELVPLDTGSWTDHRAGLDQAPLALAPSWLNVPKPTRDVASGPVPTSSGLSLYAEAALADACHKILNAPAGLQEETLHRECFSIGTLAGCGGIPERVARGYLLHAARALRDYDLHRPWRAAELEDKVNRSFDLGMLYRREARRA
jgi:hypothetical protein